MGFYFERKRVLGFKKNPMIFYAKTSFKRLYLFKMFFFFFFNERNSNAVKKF